MDFNKNMIESIIENEFINDIYGFLDGYFADPDSFSSVEGNFVEIVNSVELEGVSEMKLLDYDVQKVGDDYELTGTLDVLVLLGGYVYFAKEDINIESIGCNADINFVFYYSAKENKYVDFSITEMFI